MHHSAAEKLASSPDVASSPHGPSVAAVKERLLAYLGRLGLKESDLIEMMADECLNRARRRAAPGSQEELLRRALEEAQRRFDHVLARTLNLTGAKDHHPIAGARAAILLGCAAEVRVDHLFRHQDGQTETASRLRTALPLATPPESNLAMPDQPISFLFSRLPQQHK